MTALNSLLELIPADGGRRLAFDFAWQSTLIGLAAVALAALWRRRPAARSAVAVTAAALFLVAPLATGLARSYGWGLFSEPAIEVVDLSVVPSLPTKISSPKLANAEPALPVVTEHRTRPADLAWRLALIAWPLASIVLLVRLARSVIAVRRLYRSATPCEDYALLSELENASHSLGVRAPELCTSPLIDSPALVTWRTMRLLMPENFTSIGGWRAVFCHELAHIARRDGASRIGFELVVAALPWQPLAWLLRREFRASCEQACDDWSVAAGADPVELAALLADFIPQSRPALVLGMSESAPATRSRIMRLLAMQSSPQPNLGRAFAISGWLVALVLAVMLALMQRSRPGGSGGDILPPWGDKPVAVAAANVRPLGDPNARRMYRVQPPDVLLIDAVKVVPKPPYKIEPLDVLNVNVLGTLPDQPIVGPHPVVSDGTITLGAAYGAIKVSGMSLGEARNAIVEHLQNLLTAPEVSVSLAESSGNQQIAGEHLVGPDGNVNLGTYGSVYVAGMTLPEVRVAVEKQLSATLDNPQVSVDVRAYNSLVYYVISEDHETGDVVHRVPWTGSETLLDAMSNHNVSNQTQTLSNCYLWISRPATASAEAQILPVDWRAIVENADTKTNWQILPGDHVFIRSRGK